MASGQTLSVRNVLVYTSAAAFCYVVVKYLKNRKTRIKTTPLRGPPNPSFIYGAAWVSSVQGADPSTIYSEWAAEYGSVVRVPIAFGGSRIVLLDPKAVNHFYVGETWTYQRSEVSRKFMARFFGKGLLWAEDHPHQRQRKALSPAFSVAAIRHLTSVFFDCAHKAKASWDQIIESSGSDETVIEVQNWMNRISLDSVGIAGFSHDFDALGSSPSSPTVLDIFDGLCPPASQQSKLGSLLFMASFVFPILDYIPTKYSKMLAHMNNLMGDIANVLLDRTRSEKGAVMSNTRAEEKSIIGLLIKAENQDTELNMNQEEVLAQMNVILFAGFDTTSSCITWALIELCKHEDLQTRLREELLETGSGDLTYEQIMHGLPFLDAFVHEVLRLHAPIAEIVRVATKQDVIPLSKPYTTTTGEIVNSIIIEKGETVAVSIHWFNRFETFWGPDAAEFNPDRWLDESEKKGRGPKEVNGHRKLLTFSDGARICIGKQFALVEFKAVLSTLVKNYEFRFRDGKDTKIGTHPSILPRAKIEGEEGMSVPLIVRRLD